MRGCADINEAHAYEVFKRYDTRVCGSLHFGRAFAVIRVILKKTAAVFLAALLFVFFFAEAAAASGEIRVFDYAGVFTSDEARMIQDAVDYAKDGTGMDFAVVTTDDTGGLNTRNFGTDFYEEKNLGSGSDYSGVLYIYDFDNGEIYILTSGKMIDYLTDGRISKALDHAFEFIDEGDYYGSVKALLSDTAEYIEAGAPDGLEYYDEETGTVTRAKTGLTPLYVALFLGIAVVSGLIVCLISRSGYKLKSQKYRYDYHKNSQVKLFKNEDILVDTFHTTRVIPKSQPPQNRGGGGMGGGKMSRSTTFRSSSGRTYGGGGRKL